MKKISMMLVVCMLLPFCMGNKNVDTDATAIQLGAVRFTPDEFGEARLEMLLEQLYDPNLITSDVTADESDQTHDVITVYYENGDQDSFCFHKIEGVWYMRKEDGTVVSDASFISDYISHVAGNGSGATATLGIPEEELLACFIPDERLDERYIFTQKLQARLYQGMEKTEAEESAREAMINEYLLYQYALQNGYALDDTLEKMMERYTEYYKAAENLQEVEAVLKEVGISSEEYLEMQEMLLWDEAAKQVIYDEKYYAYRHGNTVMGEKDCSDFTEYWNTFLLEVVPEEMKGFDLTEYEKVLDEAAAFAWEYIE